MANRVVSDLALGRSPGGCHGVLGIWPILHRGSFERVTGRKIDLRLVGTAGALIAVIGVPIPIGSWRRRVSREDRVLAFGAAAAFFALDVVLEGAIVAGWITAIRQDGDGDDDWQ